MRQKAFFRDKVPVKPYKQAVKHTGIAGSLDEFLAALSSRRKPQSECHDNIKSLAMVFAAIESAKKKRRVKVKV
jgi:hypothetical protein